MIVYTENITALSVFNVEILRQSSNRKYGSKKTMFGWYIKNEEKKSQAEFTVIILLSNTKSTMQILTHTKRDQLQE